MNHPRSGFVNVDELMPRISLEQVAQFYGVQLPEMHRVGEEVRMRCFLNCGCPEQTGDRALAMKVDHPVKQWKCHQYGCGKGGNLISLCDLIKPGQNMDGRPRGERFKAIVADLKEMAGGVMFSGAAPTLPAEKAEKPRANVPLKDSPNERARALVELDAKFIGDPAEMNPKAASYFRKRPYLTPEVCEQWRMGYLPRDAGGDKAGGTMRGKIVYALRDDDGEVLAWFGRDPEYEDKHTRWAASGKQGREPEKVHFVKGFHRGLELFGQHELLLAARAGGLADIGLLVVEGPNDVIRMSTLEQPAVGLCSNTVSREQAAKVGRIASQYAGNRVTLLLDNDPEGEKGAMQAMWEIAKCGAAVQLGWWRTGEGARYADRQPESLTAEEWAELKARILQGAFTRTVTAAE